MSLFDGSYSQLTYFDVSKCIDNAVERNGDDESTAESWVDIAPSRGSLSSIDALGTFDVDPVFKDFSRDSPISPHSSHIEFEPNLEQVKYHLTKEVPVERSTDWIWDWNSRPEAIPPRGLNRYSVLSTPPNSPEQNSTASCYRYKRRRSLTRLEMLFGLVVSNLFTFMIGAAIGFYMCKRLVRDMKEY